MYGVNYAPELTGIGKFTGDMCEWLASQGHSVRMVTAPPYYPQWAVGEGFSAWRWKREQRSGVDVWRCPLWVPSHPRGLTRLVHLMSFALSSLPVMLLQCFWRPSLVLVVEPPLFCAPACAITARLSRAKAWLHIQDYEVDAAFDMGLLKGRRLRQLVSKAEGWLMRRFDRVSSISGRMVERGESKGVDPARMVLFPNWVDISSIRPSESTYRQELGIASGAVVTLYSGNMGGKQGLEVLAQAARSFAGDDKMYFVFCGDGSAKANLVQQCAGLSNVTFLPLQPLERLGELLSMADIHVLPQRADAADLVMPSKLTGMMASGRPVIACAPQGTELASVVQDRAECGIVVAPEDSTVLVAALRELAADPDRRVQFGRNARQYAERELDREAVLRKFEQRVLDCIAGK